MAAEEWMATCKDRYDKLYGIWATWINHTNKAVSNSLTDCPHQALASGMVRASQAPDP